MFRDARSVLSASGDFDLRAGEAFADLVAEGEILGLPSITRIELLMR